MGCNAQKQSKHQYKQQKENQKGSPQVHEQSQEKPKQHSQRDSKEKQNQPSQTYDKQKVAQLFQLEHQQIYRNKKFQSEYFITEEQIQCQSNEGKLFIVEHKVTGLKRIVKITKNVLTDYQLQEYIQYIQQLRKIDHPNIIKQCDIYNDEHHIYLVKEYCEGGNLKEKFSKENHNPDKTLIAFIVQQILKAIFYMHAQNLVHKNITSNNILMDQKSKYFTKLIGHDEVFYNHQDLNTEISYRAPETFSESYKWQASADIWSIGVLLYELLVGIHPFQEKQKNKTFENIKEKKLKGNENYKKLDQESQELITQMLNQDQTARPTSKECLNHNFFKSIKQASLNVSGALLRAKNFKRKNELRIILLSLMIEYLLPKDERDRIAETFNKIDSDMDGRISKRELINLYKANLGDDKIAKQEVERIFKQLDLNENQNLEFNEFLIGTCDINKLLSEENLKLFFNKLDKDCSQQVSANELKIFFVKTDLTEFEWQELMKLGDSIKDQNNKLSYDELVALLKENG